MGPRLCIRYRRVLVETASVGKVVVDSFCCCPLKSFLITLVLFRFLHSLVYSPFNNSSSSFRCFMLPCCGLLLLFIPPSRRCFELAATTVACEWHLPLIISITTTTTTTAPPPPPTPLLLDNLSNTPTGESFCISFLLLLACFVKVPPIIPP